MRKLISTFIAALILTCAAGRLPAAPAISVLGRDFTFPNKIDGLPAKLSDFPDLQINSFTTSDGVKLAYWEAGTGKPLIFVPGWSANGAEYINVMYLLRKQFHVYVLDPRNQGLSQKVDFGNRISRYSTDLHEFSEHIGATSAYYCGWSMGASILWGYIDLFGTRGIEKAIFIDEPPSILGRPDMSPQQRLDAGAIADTPQGLADAMSAKTGDSLMDRLNAMDALAYANSEQFARTLVPTDPVAINRIMWDHMYQDWRDVIATKINVPSAIFTGEFSHNVASQKWMHSVIPGSALYVYTKAEQGDHFLAFKNPSKFVSDLQTFLESGGNPNSKPSTDSGIETQKLEPRNVTVDHVTYHGQAAIHVRSLSSDDAKFDIKTSGTGGGMVLLEGTAFHNGTIEVDVAGTPQANAPAATRGFVGIAFRVPPAAAKYDYVYIRPTNGRADDQKRRNHSTQYASFPDNEWLKLRNESPGKYESYTDLIPSEWTHLKIEVDGLKIRLYVNGATQPTLLVNDLKPGDTTGALAPWIGVGTEAYFANLRVETDSR